jgi:ferredoxin
MPIVEFEEREIRCEEGAVLRDVLLSAGESPHNGPTDALNCAGHSTCGTCAVSVEGPTSDHTDLEQWRLSLPPHRGNDGLRLACQTRVHGDVDVEKHEGFWGQHVDGDTDGGGDGGAGESAASADGDQ